MSDYSYMINNNDEIIYFDNSICCLFSVNIYSNSINTLYAFDIECDVNIGDIYIYGERIYLVDTILGIVYIYSLNKYRMERIAINDYILGKYKVFFNKESIVFFPYDFSKNIYFINISNERVTRRIILHDVLNNQNASLHNWLQIDNLCFLTLDKNRYINYNFETHEFQLTSLQIKYSIYFMFCYTNTLYAIIDENNCQAICIIIDGEIVKKVKFGDHIRITRTQILENGMIYLLPSYGNHIYYFYPSLDGVKALSLNMSESERKKHSGSNFNSISFIDNKLYLFPRNAYNNILCINMAGYDDNIIDIRSDVYYDIAIGKLDIIYETTKLSLSTYINSIYV